MKSNRKVAVIGGGASGMAAAITAKKHGAQVVLFEKNDRVGKKILATGNGKCNLGNLTLSEEQYYCKDREKLQKLLQKFSVEDTISFFEGMGLMVKNKNGYLYPYSEQASAVLDVLRKELAEEQVQVMAGREIIGASYRKDRGTFEVKDLTGCAGQFQKLIVACGSPASQKRGAGMGGYELAKGFGHQVSDLLPGLVQLRSGDGFIKALSGVRCQGRIYLAAAGRRIASEQGELQFTDYGISGIPVFQLSRIAARCLMEKKSVIIMADFFPDQETDSFLEKSRLRYETKKERTLEDYLTGTLHKKINMAVLKMAGLGPGMKAKEAGWDGVRRVMELCRAFPIHISAANSMENAQVCAGGVDFGQVSEELESRLVKGLYFAGEVLDVDGKCGGYNLQWAWTSGYIAGKNAAESMK